MIKEFADCQSSPSPHEARAGRGESSTKTLSPHPGPTAVEIRLLVGKRQARRAAMFIVPGANTLKLRRSAMLSEHFAPPGLGRCGVAMAINIALLTEFACVCSALSFLNSTAVPRETGLKGILRTSQKPWGKILTRVRWQSLHLARIFNPNGIVSVSPGLRGTSYPGWADGKPAYPNGVAPHVLVTNHNTVGVEFSFTRGSPRVARPSQPWA